jgi:hypothetical protein
MTCTWPLWSSLPPASDATMCCLPLHSVPRPHSSSKLVDPSRVIWQLSLLVPTPPCTRASFPFIQPSPPLPHRLIWLCLPCCLLTCYFCLQFRLHSSSALLLVIPCLILRLPYFLLLPNLGWCTSHCLLALPLSPLGTKLLRVHRGLVLLLVVLGLPGPLYAGLMLLLVVVGLPPLYTGLLLLLLPPILLMWATVFSLRTLINERCCPHCCKGCCFWCCPHCCCQGCCFWCCPLYCSGCCCHCCPLYCLFCSQNDSLTKGIGTDPLAELHCCDDLLDVCELIWIQHGSFCTDVAQVVPRLGVGFSCRK